MNRHKSSSLLKDTSWIRRTDEEDEDVDRDPNYGRSVLSQRNSGGLPSSEETKTTTRTTSRTTSVEALAKRFSGGQDEPKSSRTTTSYTRSSYSDSPGSSSSITTTRTVVTEEPKTSTRTTSVSKDGKTTETTTTTTTQSLRSPVIKSPTVSDAFTQRVKSSSKAPAYSSYSPTRKLSETTVTSDKDAEDKLYDKLIPSAIKSDYSPTDSRKTVTTETVTVKSSADTEAEDHLFNTLVPSSPRKDYSPTDSKITSTETVTVKNSGNGIKTTTTTRTSSSAAEDDLYDSLLPGSIRSASSLSSPVSSSSTITKREVVTVESSRGGESPTLSSPSSTRRISYRSYTDDTPTTRTSSYTISTTPSDDYTSERKSYTSYSRPDSSYEYSSLNSPTTTYTTKSYRTSSRSDDVTDSVFSSSSLKRGSERTVLEKDLCTSCRKPFTGDAKMVLDEKRINCHASCFKCDVCKCTLGHMKAGDSMWIYKDMVHCENCFEVTREKWRR